MEWNTRAEMEMPRMCWGSGNWNSWMRQKHSQRRTPFVSIDLWCCVALLYHHVAFRFRSNCEMFLSINRQTLHWISHVQTICGFEQIFICLSLIDRKITENCDMSTIMVNDPLFGSWICTRNGMDPGMSPFLQFRSSILFNFINLQICQFPTVYYRLWDQWGSPIRFFWIIDSSAIVNKINPYISKIRSLNNRLISVWMNELVVVSVDYVLPMIYLGIFAVWEFCYRNSQWKRSCSNFVPLAEIE